MNDALMGNPALIQTSGSQTAKGDNATALAMAQIASKTVPELGGQTFNQSYATVTAALGQSASMVNNQIEDQNVVANMLTQQRNSLSGVSLDEEMANMMTYQKAFQASAKIVSTVDEMLTTIIGMKQ